MPKYPKKITSIRSLSIKQIPKLVKKNPLTALKIINSIYADNVELCDNDVKCSCGKFTRKSPEWKHQIRWAILDLKYRGKIRFNEKTGEYSLNKNPYNVYFFPSLTISILFVTAL